MSDGSSIQIGPDGTGQPIRDGVGCVLQAIAVAILWWAMIGFPGLGR